MKILKEAKKDELPITFLTDFVSNGWEEVGKLKDQAAAIKTTFSGTAKVEKIMQSLIDAYLIALGQMELHMQNKDYIEFPEDIEKEVTESLKESIEDDILDNIIDDNDLVDVESPELIVVKPVTTKTVVAIEPVEKTMCLDTFDCDFDEPDLTKERITDNDLYSHLEQTK